MSNIHIHFEQIFGCNFGIELRLCVPRQTNSSSGYRLTWNELHFSYYTIIGDIMGNLNSNVGFSARGESPKIKKKKTA